MIKQNIAVLCVSYLMILAPGCRSYGPQSDLNEAPKQKRTLAQILAAEGHGEKVNEIKSNLNSLHGSFHLYRADQRTNRLQKVSAAEQKALLTFEELQIDGMSKPEVHYYIQDKEAKDVIYSVEYKHLNKKDIKLGVKYVDHSLLSGAELNGMAKAKIDDAVTDYKISRLSLNNTKADVSKRVGSDARGFKRFFESTVPYGQALGLTSGVHWKRIKRVAVYALCLLGSAAVVYASAVYALAGVMGHNPPLVYAAIVVGVGFIAVAGYYMFLIGHEVITGIKWAR